MLWNIANIIMCAYCHQILIVPECHALPATVGNESGSDESVEELGVLEAVRFDGHSAAERPAGVLVSDGLVIFCHNNLIAMYIAMHR